MVDSEDIKRLVTCDADGAIRWPPIEDLMTEYGLDEDGAYAALDSAEEELLDDGWLVEEDGHLYVAEVRSDWLYEQEEEAKEWETEREDARRAYHDSIWG
jgi:hypothetical protein